jgi:hypothetical protein
LRFRKTVVNLVLNTDIASPERTQITKSKWKEAFGDPFETVERKMRAAEAAAASGGRRLSIAGKEIVSNSANRGLMNRRMRGRGSMVSELSIDEGEDSFDDEIDDDIMDGDDASLTPENSDHEDLPAGSFVSGVSRSHGSDRQNENNSSDGQHALVATSSSHHVRSASLSHVFNSAERRMSTCSRQTTGSKYRLRLGILRTVDLSGETIETYRRESISASSVATETYTVDLESDEPDELKATVVMEVLMTAADVAHNLQGWDHMVKWSGMLYMELRAAFQASRGADPEPRWFENQIGFLESYLMPLARRLEDTGIFGEVVGAQFARIVEENHDRWLTEGFEVTRKCVQEGSERYPIENE